MDILVVIDMQNDFIDGALGTPEAEAIVPNVVDRVKNFDKIGVYLGADVNVDRWDWGHDLDDTKFSCRCLW